MKGQTVEIGLVNMQCPECKRETQHSVEKSEGSVMNECSVCGTKHGTMTMGLGETGGQLITDLVREVAWEQCKRDKAILMLLANGEPELMYKMADELCLNVFQLIKELQRIEAKKGEESEKDL